MRLDQLRYLLEIANAGSILKASRNLHISHQSLQKTLNTIENELEVKIFERTPHGVTLTASGKLVIDYAREILQRTEQLSLDTRQLQQTASLTPKKEALNCEVATTIGELVFSTVLSEFTKQFPNVSLMIREGESFRIIDNIFSGDCLFGIIAWNRGQDPFLDNTNVSNFIRKFLFEDKVYATFSVNHPLSQYKSLSFRTVLQYPLAVYLVDDLESHTLYQFLQRRFPDTKIHISTNNLQVLEQQIQAGNAVGITPGNFHNFSPFYNDKSKVKSVKIKDALPQVVSAIINPQYYDEHKEKIDTLLDLIIMHGRY